MIRIELPFPPSVWDMYEGWGKTRHLSAEYAKWRRDAGYFIKGKHKPLTVPFVVHIGLKRPNKRQDVDNRIKPVLDALQHYGVIKNDNLCHRVTAEWAGIEAECVVLVQEHVEEMVA